MKQVKEKNNLSAQLRGKEGVFENKEKQDKYDQSSDYEYMEILNCYLFVQLVNTDK